MPSRARARNGGTARQLQIRIGLCMVSVVNTWKMAQTWTRETSCNEASMDAAGASYRSMRKAICVQAWICAKAINSTQCIQQVEVGATWWEGRLEAFTLRMAIHKSHSSTRLLVDAISPASTFLSFCDLFTQPRRYQSSIRI